MIEELLWLFLRVSGFVQQSVSVSQTNHPLLTGGLSKQG